jgi:lipopolysaccharide exporter
LSYQKTGIAAFAISGVRWNYLGSAATMLCSLTIGAVVARILGPGPFGQVIIATMISGFVNLFVDGGFSQALVQRKELDPTQVRRTFTCQVGIGLVTTLAIYLAAPWIARTLHDASAVSIIRAMSLLITAQSFGLVSSALLRRSMRFKVIQYASLSSYLFGYLVIGIPLALCGRGVWSLVFAYLAQSSLNAILLNLAARHAWLPSFRMPERSITTYGVAVIGTNVVNWGHANLDNVAASRLGSVALGLYGRASNLAYQPCTAMINSIQSVLLSSSAKAQEKHQVLHDLALTLIGIVLGILGPAYATLAFIPDTVILGFYGDKWIAVIPLMLPFALAMPVYGAHALLGPILAGLGRPNLEFWPQAVSCGVAVIAYGVAARYSLVAISWAFLAVTVLRFCLIAAFTLFSLCFGGVLWSFDQLLRNIGAGPSSRLVGAAVVAPALLGYAIWTKSHWIFGHHAVRFLCIYGEYLPPIYIGKLQMGTTSAPRPSTSPF